MNKLWFKAKQYGYGWYPCSWEGWLVTLIYILVLLGFLRTLDLRSSSASDMLIGMVLPFVILTFILILICVKTGERARWRWGK
ncbi:MAG: hypothetical protein ACP5NS_00210 [Candidatus Pacearchaeota archaeon]